MSAADLTHAELLRRAGNELGDLSRLMLEASAFSERRLQAAIEGVLPASFTPLSPPRIGLPWPGQGGIYAGISRGEAGQPDQHLIVAPAYLTTDQCAYGPRNVYTSGAQSERDGAANTRALIADGRHPAAAACAGVEFEGHADYFLPSRRQLALCFANVGDAFDSTWYWSSTQGSRDGAFVQGFEYGFSDWSLKDDEYRVRACRGLPLHPFNTSSPDGTAEGGSREKFEGGAA